MLEKVFVNAHHKTIQEFIDLVVMTIDKGQKARTISSIQLPELKTLREEGALYFDAGGVCLNYSYPARTSAVSIAWWRDYRNRLHIRVVGKRTYAVKAAGGEGPIVRLCEEGWEGVYPERHRKLLDLKHKRKHKRLNSRGSLGQDDRFSMLYWEISACSKEGLIICDHLKRPKIAQVIVTCPSTGHRHHIGIPPKFANPQTKTYQQLGSEAARVQAAIAWTFDLKPEQYNLITAS